VKGRPRLDVAREPSGRPSRAYRRALEAELAPKGLIAAAELKRYWANAANQARLETYGTPIGQLLLRGELEALEYAAGRHWDRLAARYLEAIAAPSPDPKAMPLEALGAAGGSDHISQIDALIIARFDKARAVLDGRELAAVRQCCEGAGRYPAGFEELLRLRRGLAALARLWRL
jgi:hypothetical protein